VGLGWADAAVAARAKAAASRKGRKGGLRN
jgi:hypothetical protein